MAPGSRLFTRRTPVSAHSTVGPDAAAPAAARRVGAQRLGAWAPLVALWLLVGALLGPSIAGDDFWWTDEARHAMGGVFILDVVRDMPLADPMGYAMRYFAQYPALALNWYLPGFYAFEAMAFAVFGVSAPVARGLVFAFCLVGVSVWFTWARRGWGGAAAFLATAAWLSPPVWNLWSRSVMLEAPVVTMLIVSLCAFQRYLDKPTWMRSILVGSSLAVALMIKQTAGFMLPALVLYALATPSRGALWRREASAGFLLTTVALALVTLHALKFGSQGLASVAGDIPEAASGATARWSLERWLFFPRTLWHTWGPYLMVLSAAGAVLPRRGGERRLPMIYAWVVCWYLAASLLLVGPNASRYTMYVFPALGLLAARPIYVFRGRAGVQGIAVLIVAVGVTASLWRTSREPTPRVDGYRAVAESIYATGTRAPMLYAGKHDGNFIFHLRRLDSARQHVVLRADKILVSLAVHKYFGMQSHVRSLEEIRDMMARYGVQYVVLESPDILKLKEFGMLARLVQEPEFEKVKVFPVVASGGALGPERVEIYRYRDFQPGNASEIVIPLPHMGREIRFRPH